jgi:uncharacterized protein (TIGR00290 family)
MPRSQLIFSWSTGKDSALALHLLRQDPSYDVVGLHTTVASAHDRVAIHGVRRTLVEAQAHALGLPLVPTALPTPCSFEDYERAVTADLAAARERGVTHVGFGDLFLEDVRAYRYRLLEPLGLTPVFPLWGRATSELAAEMLRVGLRAKLTCIDLAKMPRALAGRDFDAQLLADLPPAVDPCGERGEFHTFAYDGPMFARPVPLAAGALVERDGFLFADFA